MLKFRGEILTRNFYSNHFILNILKLVTLLLSIFATTVTAAVNRKTNIPYEDMIIVSSSGSNSILQYAASTGKLLEVFVPSGSGGLSWPEGLAIDSNANLYVSSFATDSILRYDGQSGAFIDTFVKAGSGGLNGPHGLKFGPDGHLYVSSYFTQNIMRYNGESGEFMGVFAPQGGDHFRRNPTSLVFGPDGNLYVVSGIDILRFDGHSGAFMDIFINNHLNAGEGLVFGPKQSLYVSDRGANVIRRYDSLSGAYLGDYLSSNDQLHGPSGLTFDNNGSLYVSNNFSNNILRHDPQNYRIDILVSDNSGGLSGPTSILLAPTPRKCVPAPSGIISWWPFDESAGNKTTDVVRSVSGTLYAGANWAPGKVLRALRLDGEDDVVDVPDIHQGNANLAQSFSIEAWLYVTKGGTAIFGNNSKYWANFLWVLGRPNDDTDTRIGLWNKISVNAQDLIFSQSRLETNKWHHVAITFSGTDDVTFIIDGEIDSKRKWYISSTPDQPTKQKTQPIPWHSLYQGIIDELSIYDRALTLTEIRTIYHAGSAGKCKTKYH